MEPTNELFESEGFRAHLFLREEKPARWEYVAASKLTSALTEERLTWKTATVAHESAHVALPKQLTLEFDLEQLFESLATQWREETEHMSNLNKACKHFAYQQIIGMGKVAPRFIVPLILRELELRPDHWFWALHEITNEDPAQPDDDFDGAVDAWLTWGKSYLR
ncbi:MAG TPA: hypothetical protein VEM96_03640 [Pyrinomonadaceae bacterium]|nr:hypothetical protein [Pyrinomonadaceae bacterium]